MKGTTLNLEDRLTPSPLSASNFSKNSAEYSWMAPRLTVFLCGNEVSSKSRSRKFMEDSLSSAP